MNANWLVCMVFKVIDFTVINDLLEPECAAWSYHKYNRRCTLKSEYDGILEKNKYYISGIMQELYNETIRINYHNGVKRYLCYYEKLRWKCEEGPPVFEYISKTIADEETKRNCIINEKTSYVKGN